MRPEGTCAARDRNNKQMAPITVEPSIVTTCSIKMKAKATAPFAPIIDSAVTPKNSYVPTKPGDDGTIEPIANSSNTKSAFPNANGKPTARATK